jgi:hypothetical protein
VLTELEVACWYTGLKCLGALASCPRLRVFHLGGIYELPSLPTQLEELSFGSTLARQISPISTLTRLRMLDLGACNYLVDITPILACTALEGLNVSRCPGLAVWPNLGALASLRWLCISFLPENSPGLDWDSLTALNALTRLTLSGFTTAACKRPRMPWRAPGRSA